MPITVIIIEDDVHYNHALKKIIDHEEGMECVAQCFSGQDAIRQLMALNPHVALVDISLQGMSGIDVMDRVAAAGLHTQYIMCTCFEDDKHIVSALRKGASGYLVKGESMDKIISSIREAHAGGVPFTAAVARKVLRQFNAERDGSALQVLTKTEKEVILLVSQGLSYREIAAKKFISVDTARKHIANIYRKLEVNNKVEAINKINGLL